jgi:hypothetical protein
MPTARLRSNRLLKALADDVAHTRYVLGLQDGATMFVGHTFAGTVVSKAGIDSSVAGWSTSRPELPMLVKTTELWL